MKFYKGQTLRMVDFGPYYKYRGNPIFTVAEDVTTHLYRHIIQVTDHKGHTHGTFHTRFEVVEEDAINREVRSYIDRELNQ